jgi:RimJ/RimL family protein N-acetyltransferase
MNFKIPQQLQTERLTLRFFKENYWCDIHEHYSDETCTKYTFERALTEADSWRTVASMVGHWYLRGYGPYVVEDSVSEAVLGIVGLWYPIDWPAPEIKWLLIRRYWGKGFASEAARAVKLMAAEYLPNLSLISFIDYRNFASIQLAKAIGAEFEKEIEFRNGKWHIYRHSRISQ